MSGARGALDQSGSGEGRAATMSPAVLPILRLFMGMLNISKPVKGLGKSRGQIQPLPSGFAEMAGRMG